MLSNKLPPYGKLGGVGACHKSPEGAPVFTQSIIFWLSLPVRKTHLQNVCNPYLATKVAFRHLKLLLELNNGNHRHFHNS
jgi:hypothetical protein